ncbi:MAG: hypothetical protein WC364_11040 [Eubacteriales bacterium]|jgi:hypothetical protein
MDERINIGLEQFAPEYEVLDARKERESELRMIYSGRYPCPLGDPGGSMAMTELNRPKIELWKQMRDRFVRAMLIQEFGNFPYGS